MPLRFAGRLGRLLFGAFALAGRRAALFLPFGTFRFFACDNIRTGSCRDRGTLDARLLGYEVG